MAANLPGLGSASATPLVNKTFDVTRARLGPEEYFVLTRVDGRTSLRELVLISGFPEGQALTILRRLRQVGAIYFAGEDPARPPPVEVEPEPPVVVDESALDPAVLAEEVDLSLEQKRMILKKHVSLAGGTYFSVLEVQRDADRKALKAAYFRMSKLFHPDRYFGHRLGSYHKLLAQIFEVASEALEVLSDDGRREEYLAALAAARSPDAPPALPPLRSAPARTPEKLADRPPEKPSPADVRRAAAIFEEACHHQVTGDLKRAIPEFAAAIAIDPQPRYLRRAAEACLKAQELRDAEEYAKKGAELDPHNASSQRVLGKVFRELGKLPEALRALQRAAELDPGNSHIAAELQALRNKIGSGSDED